MKIGDTIRHNKRQTFYEVVGEMFVWDPLPPDGEQAQVQAISTHDGDILTLEPVQPVTKDFSFRLIVTIQQSEPLPEPDYWIIYRQLDGPLFFARPRREFTDRFTII